MIFRKPILDRIRAGEIHCAFRRWHRASVKAGGTLRTAVGVIGIDAVRPAKLEDLTAAEARQAGYDSVAALRESLRSRDDGILYRIDLHYAGEDPRIELRHNDRLSPSELTDILARLDRMDAPWTRSVLMLIGDNEAVRAATLAQKLGRERLAFKRDVRKLKNLGLTESLEVGYRLSPRGRAVLSGWEKRGGDPRSPG